MGNSNNPNLSSLDDNKLITLIKSGDSKAFNTLAERYLIVIRAKATSFRGVGIELDDFVQEGFIAFINAVKTYDENGGASFSTYAGVCIERRFLSIYKSEKRQKKIPTELLVPLDDSGVSDGQNIDVNPLQDFVEEAELKDQIISRIKNRLSPFEQKALSFYLSGYTYGQTAKALNSTAKSVDNALQRVRKKLRQD